MKINIHKLITNIELSKLLTGVPGNFRKGYTAKSIQPSVDRLQSALDKWWDNEQKIKGE